MASLSGGDGEVLHRAPPDDAEARSYNVMQRTAYVILIFVLFPMMIWTGLAMSPAFTSVAPSDRDSAGRKADRADTHFFLTWALVLFVWSM